MSSPSTDRQQNQAKLLKVHHVIAENTSDGVIGVDANGEVLLVNSRAVELLGYPEAAIRGRNVLDLVDPDTRERLETAVTERLELDEKRQLAGKSVLYIDALRGDGQTVPVEASLVGCDPKEEIRIVILMRSLLHRARMTETLRAVRDSYAALSETTTDAIIQISAALRILYANKAAADLFGHETTEMIQSNLSMLFPPTAYGHYSELFGKYFLIDDAHRKATKMSNVVEVLGQNEKGQVFPLEISIGNSRNVLGERVATCIMRDISDRKRTERKLRFLAYHDKLTELGNRDLLYTALRRHLSEETAQGTPTGALMFLDLDGFKRVNDNLGHDAGDQILKEATRRMALCLRQSDRLYRIAEEGFGAHEALFRFGGDEFVIFLTELEERANAATIAQRLIDSVSQPYDVETEDPEAKADMGVSIGIALVPEDGRDSMQLIRNADVAMYKAKQRRNSYVFFSEELKEQASQRLELESGIRDALEQRSFALHYQPLVDPEGVIKGAEALLRMNDRDGRPVSPALFIPIAEEIGLVAAIGDWVFRTACTQLREWNDAGFPDFYMSINLSVKHFSRADLVDGLTRIIEATGANPANLRVEVTESCLLEDPGETRRKMLEMKERNPGIRIAIDDFGAGYSSLSYLSDLPVDVVKIDQSFVMNLYTQRHNPTIVNTILALADSLHMDAIAEGVETEEQLHYLVTKQCKSFQGYYFSRPVVAENFTELLRQGLNP